MPEEEVAIQPLREDLSFSPAPSEDGGAPVWMLHDPVADSFLRADWSHFQILKRLDRTQTFPELLERLQRQTTLRLPPEEVKAFVIDLAAKGLLRSQLFKSAKELKAEVDKAKLSPIKWFLHHYLYFRVPLIHPDAFLERTAHHARMLVSKTALCIYAVLALCALHLLSQHFDLYLSTVGDFLNWRGALAFGAAIACVKLLHEFAHAYAAKLLGNRVPSMGLAFIVLWPVPYCDVTDSWRMDSRQRRLLISAAGILCELVLAAASLTLWATCENSLLRGIFFMLSSSSLAGTLLVNLNPAMRFDGYYIFCDLLRIDNLYSRASEYLKYRYRLSWLGIELQNPEPDADRRLRITLLSYAVCSWIYRFFLYLGIAIIVYHAFPKIIGITLFALEIWLFIVRPAANEVRQIMRLRVAIKPQATGLAIAGVLLLVFMWAALPLPRLTAIPAVYEPEHVQVVYAPVAGILRQVKAANGNWVRKGDVLTLVESAEIEQSIASAKAGMDGALAEIRLASSQRNSHQRLRELQDQLIGVRAKLQSLLEQRESCRIRADADGVISSWQDTATEGAVVGSKQELGLVCAAGAGRIQGYVDASMAVFVPIEASATFVPDSGEGSLAIDLANLSRVRERELRYSSLSANMGGEIPIQAANNGKLMIDGSYFLLHGREAAPKGQLEARTVTGAGSVGGGQTGKLWFWSNCRSHLAAYARTAWRTIMRESGM